MNEIFKVFNDFKGFGNPNAKLWFVGLEEALSTEKDFEKNVLKYSKGVLAAEKDEIKNDASEFKNKYTKVYDIMSKIIVGLSSNEVWRQYRNEKLLKELGNEFQMNLYPLGKKNLKDWPNFYEEKFGFKDKKEYLEKVKGERFSLLYNFWKEKNPDFTICFGIGNVQDFKDAFVIKDEVYESESNTYFSNEKKILITPFFDYRCMSQITIDKVISIIKDNSPD